MVMKPGPLQVELPPELRSLADLASDVLWTWSHAGDVLWQMIDPESWAQSANPYVILQNVTRERMRALMLDTKFREELDRLVSARMEYLSRPCWCDSQPAASAVHTAYFSMEFGLGEALPLYAGGLGILAGDHLKAASDLGIPLAGVGLLYQEGYFRQMLDVSGEQRETYPYNDTASMPVVPAQTDEGDWLQVSIEFPGRVVRFRVWQVQVGRVVLYLLDSNDPLNSPHDRGITGKLYGGGQEMRLVQEIALGIGGWRVLEALGLPIDVCHLNEGHAAFVTLERARAYMQSRNVEFREALWATRAGNIFTTHTPVPSGFDAYEPMLLAKYAGNYGRGFDVAPSELMGLGRRNPADNHEPFNMAYLAARTCGFINGVSRLHGQVSRRIFRDLYPRWPLRDVPVTHVTNGVHVPTWDSSWADAVWTESCGKDRWLGTLENLGPTVESLGDDTLWTFRGRGRGDLVRYARRRLARQLGQRGVPADIVARARDVLDPNALTLGFARRFAEYKRPNLLLHDQERLQRLLTNRDRPVQIIVAGKAHPQDPAGKQFVREWAGFVRRPEVRAHAVFLEDYDITLAQELGQGVDLWLNTPRRPWEACGTSGMKVLVNGGLNLSELDGWWAEAFASEVGWALGDGREHAEPGWDAIEAAELYRLLEEDVVPAFYERDAHGIPRSWVARMRASMARLAPHFSSNRMVREYVERLYVPAAKAFKQRVENEGLLARKLQAWESNLIHHWQGVHLGDLEAWRERDGWLFVLPAYLGEIAPQQVAVELYADPLEDDVPMRKKMERQASIPGTVNGYVYRCVMESTRPAEHFTPRVIPDHPQAHIPAELNLVFWGSGAVQVHATPAPAVHMTDENSG